MLVFLLLAARWLQARQHRRAAGAAEILYALTPSSARRLSADEQEAVVAIEAVAVGDRILARAGETIAVDGVVERGTSAVDAGLLTGEPRPVDVAPGDTVVAGAVNLSAPIVVRATATGEDTRVGRLAARLTELAHDRPQITQLVDRVAGRFVVVVLAAAVLTTILWWHAGAGIAVEHAMALLVVTCPCALALAAPLSFGLAIGRAARQGVLVKGHDALERLASPGTMVLDKTGTITRGQLRLVGWSGDARVRPTAIALERASAHPLARAMVDADEPAGLTLAPRLADVHEELGRGIRGVVDGVALAIGSPRWIGERAAIAPDLAADIAAAAARGETPVVIAKDGHAVAIARFADPIRPDAASSIQALTKLGFHVEILSGDDPRVVAQVGQTLGLAPEDCRGGATPEDKLARIQALAARAPGGHGRRWRQRRGRPRGGDRGHRGARRRRGLGRGRRRVPAPARPRAGRRGHARLAARARRGPHQPPHLAVLQPHDGHAGHGRHRAPAARGRADAAELADRPLHRRPVAGLFGSPMNALYLILPLALVIAAGAVAAFVWAVRDGQLDDLDTPPRRMLTDDEA